MKALILALALFGDTHSWDAELTAGLTCPTPRDAQTVASIAQSYSFAATVENRTRCLFMAFTGTKIGETAVFGIGDRLYHFDLIRSENWTFYVLRDDGEGYTA